VDTDTGGALVGGCYNLLAGIAIFSFVDLWICDLHFKVILSLIITWRQFCTLYVHVFQVREEEKNQRQDLFILATSYSGQLKAKSASMIRENDFHQVSDKVTLLVALLSKKKKGARIISLTSCVVC